MTSELAGEAAPATRSRASRRAVRTITPGSRAFVGVLSMCMAVTALAIDSLLPAFDEIRAALGLAPDAIEVTGLITAFFVGNSLGLLPAGLLADRIGRRPVMWLGLGLYIAGAIASIIAPTLATMVIARFFWGIGAAGPRVAALAMVRDEFVGEQMARQMSLIMAVFLLVPAVAPLVASGVLAVGPWWSVFAMCAAVAAVVAGLVVRLPETLPDRPTASTSATPAVTTSSATAKIVRAAVTAGPVADVANGGGHRTHLFGRFAADVAAVFRTPGVVAYTASLTALFAAFLSYLASSEIIIDQVFGLERWFPVIFGALALAMLCGMLVNGRFVESIGLRRLIAIGFSGNLLVAIAFVVVALSTGGTPPFWLFAAVLAALLFTQQMLLPNVNAAGMRSLGAFAGTGAALLGMIPGVLGALLGNLIDRQFDGTITPLAVAFAVCSTVGQVCWRIGERSVARATTA